MDTIPETAALANLPVGELRTTLQDFLAPVLRNLPDERLRRVATLAVEAITSSQSPVIAQMARTVSREEGPVWPIAKRFYRFCANPRFSHRDLLKGLYALAQRTVADARPAYLVVAVDPVNFEKPYTETLEGVSTVMKSTPPGPHGEKRLPPGYPALTATIVNLTTPVITYANWFSYVTADFVSENREIERALRTTRALFPHQTVRFVADSGLDDQKIFDQIDRVQGEFIIRACHLNRIVEVSNERLDRWERESLADLAATVPFGVHLEVAFTHARRVRTVTVGLGWLTIRLPGRTQILGMLVAHDPDLDRDLVLLTNVPINHKADAITLYTDWRCRPRIEHTYRFDQEDGLQIEDIRVQTLERMRRLFVLVLLAALFVYHVDASWPRQAVLWLRRLGGKLGRRSDLDGPYVLLAGISAVLVTVATFTFAIHDPFPHQEFSYG
jgi:Transposase DDE domain